MAREVTGGGGAVDLAERRAARRGRRTEVRDAGVPRRQRCGERAYSSRVTIRGQATAQAGQ